MQKIDRVRGSDAMLTDTQGQVLVYGVQYIDSQHLRYNFFSGTSRSQFCQNPQYPRRHMSACLII
jgi:uncharacterized protein (DUF427 family)